MRLSRAMDTFRFRKFEVYKDAKKFRRFVQELIKKFPASEKFGLVDQINRACRSILLNIAEGSAKKSDKDFARYLEMSIASVSEVVAGFDLAHDDQIITSEDFERVEMDAGNIAKQLGGFIKSLKIKS